MPLTLLTEDTRRVVRDDELGVSNGDPDVTYTLRPMLKPTLNAIHAKHGTKVLNRRTQQHDVTIDWKAVAEDVLDHVLVDWAGVNLRGEPAPCTRDLKLLGLDQPRQEALIALAQSNPVTHVVPPLDAA